MGNLVEREKTKPQQITLKRVPLMSINRSEHLNVNKLYATQPPQCRLTPPPEGPPFTTKCVADVKSKIRLCQSMPIALRNNRAEFHPHPTLYTI